MAKRFPGVRSACVLALVLAASEQQVRGRTNEAPSAEADSRAARGWLESYSAIINAGDLVAFGKLWAEDADWAPPDAPMLSGRRAILEHVRTAFDKYAIHHAFTSQGVRVADGFAVALITSAERYAPKVGAGAAWEQSIKGTVILRRADDGSWAATYFIWNRDAPPAH